MKLNIECHEKVLVPILIPFISYLHKCKTIAQSLIIHRGSPQQGDETRLAGDELSFAAASNNKNAQYIPLPIYSLLLSHYLV